MLLQPPRLNVAATYTQTQQRMGPRHLGFAEIASKGDIDLLLHGDSITDWWVQGDANKAMFDKYFGNIKTANFAVAGDTTQGVLWGLKNGEGQGFQPKAVMLMIGTNNSGASTAPEIAEGVGAVVLEMRKDFPNAKILLLAIFPRSTPGDPGARQDRGSQQDHLEAGRPAPRLLHGHRRQVPGREGGLPPGFVPGRQPAPAGQGLRHLGRRCEG